jgi:hypothetical protein
MAGVPAKPAEMEQRLMTTTEQKTCAHIPCTCQVESGQKYCSDSCKDAGSGEVEIACECGHTTCTTSIEEVA